VSSNFQRFDKNIQESMLAGRHTSDTDELSRQLMCIVRCHWEVYSSFSTCNSAIHRHHRR